MKSNLMRRIAALVAASAMVLTSVPAWAADGINGTVTENAEQTVQEQRLAQEQEQTQASEQESANEVVLEEGTYVTGEVIVIFREGAVKDRKVSLKSAQKLENVGDDFGEVMGSANEEDEAAEDVKSEISILKRSLGDDFVIEESIAFDKDLITCLVKSEKYSTEVLIEKLADNPDIDSAEPNYITEESSLGNSAEDVVKTAEYSLNDQLNQYAYGVNSPDDVNKAGRNVSSRGGEPGNAPSTRAGTVTDFTADHSGDDEVVVAVVDSGVNYDHEDLKNMLWVNDPEKTGLEGKYGFNFHDNDVDVKDRHGHGSHVAGIIAAQANNSKGLAGVASGVNVKVMMLAIGSASENPEQGISSIYRRTGCLFYALRAKQAGVNVVAANCSWGSAGSSLIYDNVINKLGEAGILTFVAACNNTTDIDVDNTYPSGGDSPYMVTVGAANPNGKLAGFSNYGKSGVDVFGPGVDILSTCAFSKYFPNLYTAEDRAGNTEYYGQFNTGVEVGPFDADLGTNRVVPDTAGEGVKPFGAAKFFAQDRYDEQYIDYDPGEPDDGQDPSDDTYPEESCELSIAVDKYFTDNYSQDSAVKPGTLKVTIKNARNGRKYYLYFPYEKNHNTTGINNTRYSIDIIMDHNEGDFDATIEGGETLKYNIGGKAVCKTLCGESGLSNTAHIDTMYHFADHKDTSYRRILMSWDEVDPEKTDVVETGIGIAVAPGTMGEIISEEQKEFDKEPHDITIYIDGLGVSKPAEEGHSADEMFPEESSYTLMSGTSQASPAVAAAYAVMTAVDPVDYSGDDAAEYALQSRAKFLSLVTRTDELKDLCSTGGYVDLSTIKDSVAGAHLASIADAVCDLKKETITLSGSGITKGMKLYTKKLAKDDALSTSMSSEQAGEQAGGAGDGAGDGDGEILIDDDRISVADDGKTLTIKDAKGLFGTYTEFILKDEGRVCARGAFFLVKGEKRPEMILSEDHKETILDDESIYSRYVFTDSKGKDLYACIVSSEWSAVNDAGRLYRFDGSKFAEYNGTNLRDSLFSWYEEKLGYDRHQLTRGFVVSPWIVRQPLIIDDTLYAFVSSEYSPHRDAEDEEILKKTYLASMDFTAERPEWTFREIKALDEVMSDLPSYRQDSLGYSAMNGKIYMFSGIDVDREDMKDIDPVTYVFSLDVDSCEWTRLPDYKGESIRRPYTYINYGKTYLMFWEDMNGCHSKSVLCFDGENWSKCPDIPFCGRYTANLDPSPAAVAPVKDGFIFFNYSVSGAGNIFLYRPETGACEPLYYTTTDGLSTASVYTAGQSAVETTDGIYYISKEEDDGNIQRYDLYLVPKSSRAYRPTYKDANPMKVSTSNRNVNASKLNKKTVKLKAVTVKKAAGKVKYKRTKIKCSKKLAKAAKKKIKVNSRTGKITLKKGLKKGTYTVSVKVTASGDDYYKSATKTVKFRIKVRA